MSKIEQGFADQRETVNNPQLLEALRFATEVIPGSSLYSSTGREPGGAVYPTTVLAGREVARQEEQLLSFSGRTAVGEAKRTTRIKFVPTNSKSKVEAVCVTEGSFTYITVEDGHRCATNFALTPVWGAYERFKHEDSAGIFNFIMKSGIVPSEDIPEVARRVKERTPR